MKKDGENNIGCLVVWCHVQDLRIFIVNNNFPSNLYTQIFTLSDMVCCHIENQDQKTLEDDSESNDESKCSDFLINDFRYW